jgi:lysophospholipase L1-like esterase
VVIGSSTTDGDGSTQDQNHRMPDVLASRLQQAGGASARIGVLNAGIIGNRLLEDSPAQSPFGAGLGEAVLARLDRDALDQPGVRFIIVAIGVNDIAFPGSFTRPDEAVSAQGLIQGYRQILSRAHAKAIKVLMTTIPPFGNAIYPEDRTLVLHTPEKEAVRRAVNEWIRTAKEADGVADFDAVLRDPAHPDRLQPRFDSGDHLHANDAGYAASAKAIPLSFFISAISLKSSPVSPKGGEQGQRFAPDPASRWTDKLETSCGCAPSGYSGSPMSTPETKQKSLFLNGVETESIEPTGNAAKDLAAARRFLAEKGIDQPQQRLTLRGKIRNVWRKKFL